MLKKTMTYDDLDGNPITEDFYFHLNKLEIMKMDLEADGGLEAELKAIVATENAVEAYHRFEKILLSAYGKKSADNKSFIKNQQLTDAFAQSDALATLVFEMLQNPEQAGKFIEQVLPDRIVKAAAEANKNGDDIPEGPPSEVTPIAPPTRKDLQEMTREELLEAMKEKVQAPEEQ